MIKPRVIKNIGSGDISGGRRLPMDTYENSGQCTRISVRTGVTRMHY